MKIYDIFNRRSCHNTITQPSWNFNQDSGNHLFIYSNPISKIIVVKNKQEILKLLGFEYDNCCFQFRINYNRTPKVDSTLYNELLNAQLVFKSLGQPSQGIGKKWQEIIKGYTDPYQQ